MTDSASPAGSIPLHESGRFDPAWLDAQYNPMPALADPTALFGDWTSRSAATRQSLACKLDVPYGDADTGHLLETLDVFPAARRQGSVPSPVLVFVHGGYWRGSDKKVYSFLAAPFVAAGITVVMPNYPLCPGVSVGEIATSLVKALQWVHAHIAEHGGDPGRITLAGHSAGGHLVAMLLSCHWQRVDPALPANLVRSALAISGLFELEPFRHAPFLAPTLRLGEDDVMRLSPARFPPPAPGLVLYAVVGGDEPAEFQRQNALIAERWGETSVPVCEAIAGRAHFTVLPDMATPGARLHRLLRQLIDS